MSKFYHEKSEQRDGLVVFDFDRSLFTIDDIDNIVAKKFLGYSSEDLMSLVKKSLGWNAMMDSLASEIFEKGFKQDDIVKALEELELDEHIMKSLEILMKNNYEQKILSDANSIFIKHVLNGRRKGLHYFNEVVTNPAYFDEKGRLRIGPFHLKEHGCKRCPTNMCKGKVIEEWVASNMYNRIIYVGDGSGDYCPAMFLRKTDVVLVRKNYDLHKLIEKEPITAKVLLWEDSFEMYQHIERLMNTKEKIEENVILDDSRINNFLDESPKNQSVETVGPSVEEVFDKSSITQSEKEEGVIPTIEEVSDEPSITQSENEGSIIPLVEEVLDEPSMTINQFEKKLLFETA